MKDAHVIWNAARYDPNHAEILDFREASLGVSMDEVKQVAEHFLRTSRASPGRAAILTDRPMKTAINVIFPQRMAPKNNLQIFSTWEAACAFVMAPDLPDTTHGG